MNESTELRLKKFRATLPKRPDDDLMLKLPITLDYFQANDPATFQAVLKNRRTLGNNWMPNLLNDVFIYLEEKDLKIEIETLLDLMDGGHFDVLSICTCLALSRRFHNAAQILDLIAQGRTGELYSFIDQYQFYSEGAIRYLESLFAKKPQTLSEMRPDEFQLQPLLSYTAQAGMSFQQQQAFNAQYAQNVLERVNQKNRRIDDAEIDIAKTRAEHDEAIRFELEKQERAIVQPMTFGGNGQSQIDYDALAKNFIQQNHLVRTEFEGKIIVYHWDNESKRYRNFHSKETWTNLFNSYVYEVYGTTGVDIVKSQLDSTVNKMEYSFIPKLSAGLEFPKLSSEMQVFFKNGYYDFQRQNFVETDTSEYFHIFSLPFDYNANAEVPKIFDKMLTAMFDNDRVKKKLAYQIIGAILSNVSLKYIYLLQGVSNGGKSTFGACIKRLFSDDEVKHLGLMEEINENAKPSKKKFKLFYIDEVSQYRHSASMKKTFSYLKTSSSGIVNSCFPEQKILMSANYPILFPTADGRDPSVENRIIVLPFARDMKAAENDENLTEEERQEFQDAKHFFDEHFEREKQGIVKKALEAFQEVLEEDKQFIQKFPLNECVIGQASSDNKSSVDKTRELKEFIEDNFDFVDSQEFQSNPDSGIKADDLRNLVNKTSPNLFGRNNELGKTIGELIRDDFPIEIRDYKDKRYYNLRLKNE